MGQSDWSNLSGSLTGSDVRSGVTAGVAPPNGGGTYVFGYRSISNVVGALGRYCLQTHFSPTDKGGRISGTLLRGTLGAATGFSPFFFFCAQSADVTSDAYIVGLSDEAAPRIELRKGDIIGGLPAVSLVDPDSVPNVLMRSTDTYDPAEWQHLRLDVIVQGTDDVILQVYRNDLDAHDVTSPVWTVVPGMEGPSYPSFIGFVDDTLGVNTGSVPLGGGFAGFGCRFEVANRSAFIDHVSIDRQI
jgi:hypothetical protein